MTQSSDSKLIEGASGGKCNIYRGLRSPDWINPKTGRIVRAAYYRRESDKSGVSIGIAELWESAHDFQEGVPLNPCHGVLGLNSHDLEGLGLSVKVKQRNSRLGNLNSTYPYRHLDQERADEMADILIGLSAILIKPNKS